MRRVTRTWGVLLALLAGGCSQEPTPDTVTDIEALATQAQQQRRMTLHEDVIGESDLPPAGTRSMLDYWVAEQGNIPFPFARFIEALAGEDAGQRAPLAVLIPDGRSLLKAEADFARPRVVVATTMQPPAGALLHPDFRGRIYLGFTEGADEIELMAYNPEAGRFEFQLITDYCEGCNPRLLYARRAICTTCHQGGVPIFSVRPWEETNAQGVIADRIAAHHETRYYGAPVRVSLDVPDAIDNLTNQAAVLVATQRAWLDGCGRGAAGNRCRRTLLAGALQWMLDPRSLDAGGRAGVDDERAQWPAEGIAVPGNDLASRNPFETSLHGGGWWSQVERLFRGEPERTVSGDKLADFARLPPLPAVFDPLVQRPVKAMWSAGDPDPVLGVALMFTANDQRRLEDAAQWSSARLMAAVADLDDALFEPAPLRRLVFVRALLNALGESPPAHRFADLGAMSAPLMENEPPLELAANSPLQPFATYCFACHRGNPSARLNFMAGADEAEVLANIRNTDAMRDSLDWDRYRGTRKEGQLMPPDDSWQRARLLEAVAQTPDNQEDPITRMRDTLPSLFGF